MYIKRLVNHVSSLSSSQVLTQQPIVLWHRFSNRDPLCLSKVKSNCKLSVRMFHSCHLVKSTIILFTPQTQKPWLLLRWETPSSGNSAFSNSLHVSLGFFFFFIIQIKYLHCFMVYYGRIKDYKMFFVLWASLYSCSYPLV